MTWLWCCTRCGETGSGATVLAANSAAAAHGAVHDIELDSWVARTAPQVQT